MKYTYFLRGCFTPSEAAEGWGGRGWAHLSGSSGRFARNGIINEEHGRERESEVARVRLRT